MSLQKANMRAKEFLTEQQLSDVHDALDVAALSLPYTFIIPELSNSNFYDLYRFGVAIARVKGDEGQEDKVQDPDRPEFRATSEWGQHPIISSFDPNLGNWVDKALSATHHKGKKQISPPGSREMKDTTTVSPIKPFKGYER